MILALVMVLSLTACGGSGNDSAKDNSSNGKPSTPNTSGDTSGSSSGGAKADDIVLWTLSNDLKQFAERYEEQTGNHVEVVVFDSADFSTKIMQTLGAKSKDVDVFVGEPQMLPNFFEAGFSANLSALDSEVKTRLVDYTYQAGCDEDGVLRAISYQACPGSVIYRLDIAEEVFGTSDPEEIGKLFASFDTIRDTANKAFHDAAIPFLDPAQYGRSPLENVSFLASSANPDSLVWGRGFVARLSGSTAEFLQMWQLMFFGPAPFQWDGNELKLVFAPFIPAYLMQPDGVIEATFLGSVKVTYHTAGLAELIPGKTSPVHWELTDWNGGKRTVEGPALDDRDARAVRTGQITEIDIIMR